MCLYSFNYHDSNRNRKLVREYNINSESWEPVDSWPELQEAGSGQSCAVVGDNIIIAGGGGESGYYSAATEIISISSKTIRAGGPLSDRRGMFPIVKIGLSQTLYALGGSQSGPPPHLGLFGKWP